MITRLHNAKDDSGTIAYIVEVRPRAFPTAHSSWFDAHSERLRHDADGALRGEASGARYRLCDAILPLWAA